jgi:D-xylose transport system permease protein
MREKNQIKEQGNEIAVQKKTKIDPKKYVMIIAFLAICAIFAILSDGTFVSARNLSNLARQLTFIAMLSTGMLSVIILGEIDLSVGSIVGLCGGIFAILTCNVGVPLVPGLVITLIMGLLFGCWNGWWIAYMRVPSFIVTLASQLVFRGVLVGLTGGKTIAPLAQELQLLGSQYIPAVVGIIIGIVVTVILLYFNWNGRQKAIKYGLNVKPFYISIVQSVMIIVIVIGFIVLMNLYKGIPTSVILIGLMFGIFYFLTQKTVYGRRLFAIGGNKSASVLAGIDVRKHVFSVFGVNGLVAAASGIFLCARLNSAAVNAGEGAELDAIAACVIGGASLMGGLGSLSGVLVGAAIMATIDNGMALLNVASFWQTIVKGLVLLIAVWFDMSKKTKS